MTRIAHISDLHCENSTDWKENFNRLTASVRQHSPDIVVITGDGVNHPKKTSFELLCDSLEKLRKQVASVRSKEKVSAPFILAVYGNHDYTWFGTKFPIFITRNLVLSYEKRINYPHESSEHVCKAIFSNYSIAFFPFDSNHVSKIFGFARGRIDNPDLSLKKYKDLYEELSRSGQ